MGFFKKAWNWVRGKGFKEEDVIQDKELEKSLEEAEQKQQPKEQEIIQKEETLEQEYEEPRPSKPKKSKSREEIKISSERFEKSGSMTKVQEKLTNGNISMTDFTPTRDLSSLKLVYDNLLKQSAISTLDREGREDRALMDVLIENRDRLVHRFTAEITIMTDRAQGTIAIDGILAENLVDIQDFIQIGRTYTSQELKEAMNEALKHFESKYGAIGGYVNPPAEKKSTVQDVKIKMTFA